MSIWTRLGEFISSVTVDAISSAVEAVRTVFEGDQLTRKQVSFSIAIIALSAKMAKADGVVTDEEIIAFEELFEVPHSERRHVSRVYNLAKQDVAGFDSYAGQIKRMFPDDSDILRDVIDGLFHIAKADGIIHELELEFVRVVANKFGISEQRFQGIKLRHVLPESGDPYVILEAHHDWDNEQLKRHYRKMVMEAHPDRLMARGVPEEFLKIANDRLADINHAWDQISRERGI